MIDTPQPYLELSREVPAGLHPKHSGFLGPSLPHCCTGRLTKLSADTYGVEGPIKPLSHVVVVRKGHDDPLRSNTQIRLSSVITTQYARYPMAAYPCSW